MSLEAILYKVRPSMTEQEYVFILSLYSSSAYYVYGVSLFELFISLTHYNCNIYYCQQKPKFAGSVFVT